MAESPEALEKTLTALWEGRDDLFAVLPEADARVAILQAVELLDTGDARVAEVVDGEVVVHEWLKYAVLLLFRISHMETIELGPFEYADKIPLKRHFQRQGVRVVPGASARWGSYLAPGAVMMPSYVNIGARVGADSMVDTWATVGSCAQIGERVHLSGGVGIGGVLEPPQAAPVIVGDDSMIGVALHRRRRRARRRRRRARRRVHPHRLHPRDRRRDRRAAVARHRARLVRRDLGDAAAYVPGWRVRPAVRARREAPERG